jgi:hypothetical protein
MLWLARWGRAGQVRRRIVVGAQCAHVACLGFGVGGGSVGQAESIVVANASVDSLGETVYTLAKEVHSLPFRLGRRGRNS